MIDPSLVMIGFETGVDGSTIPTFAMGVLRDILARSNNRTATISSLVRSPLEQARAMFANLEREGVASQRAIYAAPGNLVIDAYAVQKAAGASADDIVAAMLARILAIGPEHVSAHCRDPRLWCVVDFPRRLLANPNDLIAAAKADPRCSQELNEGCNDCDHIVIPLPQLQGCAS